MTLNKHAQARKHTRKMVIEGRSQIGILAVVTTLALALVTYLAFVVGPTFFL
ncbi:MAG: hypothetical protein AAFO73_10230 [Pseudomonadota bacterium]